MDEHYLQATSSRSATYVINNVAPVFAYNSVVLQGGNDIELNIKPNTTYVYASSTDISDNNSCVDIVSATSSIYLAATSTWNNYDCTADNDDCYQISSTGCSIISGTCTGPSDLDVTIGCTTTLQFYAAPSDPSAGNSNADSFWLGAIKAWDEALWGVGTSAANVVEVITTEAIDVQEDLVDYLSIKGGQDSGNINATTTIENFGNCPLDTSFLGYDMLRTGGGDYVGSDQQEYDLITFTYGAGTWTLSSTTPATRDTVLPKPNSGAIDVEDEVYWGLGIPGGTLSGIYTGSTTFTAILDDAPAW